MFSFPVELFVLCGILSSSVIFLVKALIKQNKIQNIFRSKYNIQHPPIEGEGEVPPVLLEDYVMIPWDLTKLFKAVIKSASIYILSFLDKSNCHDHVILTLLHRV